MGTDVADERRLGRLRVKTTTLLLRSSARMKFNLIRHINFLIHVLQSFKDKTETILTSYNDEYIETSRRRSIVVKEILVADMVSLRQNSMRPALSVRLCFHLATYICAVLVGFLDKDNGPLPSPKLRNV
jgi:hypothetical protein